MLLRIARTVARTEAEGPGARFAVWTQGCPLRCPGCCNPEMFAERGGVETEVASLLEAVAAQGDEIEGITLLGGEPFAQASGCAELAAAVRSRGLSVVVFSGYTLEELRASPDPGVARLLAATDLLFDGRFERERPEPRRRWIGSANQRAHFLSERYRPDDSRLTAENTVEIRFAAGELAVNGWPAAADAVLSRRKVR